MLTLKNLTTGYDTKSVSKNLNATLQEGQLTCLIGPNGTGKSTLLRTIAGFLNAISGDIFIDGKSTQSYTSNELSRLISIVLTDNTHIKGLTAYEVVGMGRSPYTGFWGRFDSHDHAVIRQCMQQMGVENMAERPIQTLSDGERQKTMIAKAMAQETPIILLDEPTAFLYYPNKVAVLLMLRQLAHDTGKTILLSIHDIDLALQVADYIWMLDEESNLISGTPRTLCDDGTIARYISNEHIEFNPQTITFKVKNI